MAGKIRAFKSASSGAFWVGDDDQLYLFIPPVPSKVTPALFSKNAQDFKDGHNTEPPEGHVEVAPMTAKRLWNKIAKHKDGKALGLKVVALLEDKER